MQHQDTRLPLKKDPRKLHMRLLPFRCSFAAPHGLDGLMHEPEVLWLGDELIIPRVIPALLRLCLHLLFDAHLTQPHVARLQQP